MITRGLSQESPLAVVDFAGCITSWNRELTALKDRVANALLRKRTAGDSLCVHYRLLSGVERKTGLLMSEVVCADRPYRIQSLIGRRRWEADRLRDSILDYAGESLVDRDVVLIVDEAWFLKKVDLSVDALAPPRPRLRAQYRHLLPRGNGKSPPVSHQPLSRVFKLTLRSESFATL